MIAYQPAQACKTVFQERTPENAWLLQAVTEQQQIVNQIAQHLDHILISSNDVI